MDLGNAITAQLRKTAAALRAPAPPPAKLEPGAAAGSANQGAKSAKPQTQEGGKT